MDNYEHGLIDNWLRHVKEVRRFRSEKLKGLEHDERFDLLCEFNVIEQVTNVSSTSIVQGAWRTGADLSVHGWIYNIENGILKDLDACITSIEDLEEKTNNS